MYSSIEIDSFFYFAGDFIGECVFIVDFFAGDLAVTDNLSLFAANLGVVDVCFFFEDAEPLYFTDIRNFGTLKVVNSVRELNKKLKSLGPDVLSPSGMDASIFRKRFLSKPNKTITECLMNQSVISGVGNYLKAEILYASQISPHRLCKDITSKEYGTLFDACYWLPRLSYKMGGATLTTYRQPNGEEGLYSRRFAVYNQKQDPLGNEVIKESTKDKRTTHWVPAVQK